MTSWMEERDRLVEQTRVFVAGVAAAAGTVRPADPVASPQATPEPAVAVAAIPAAPGSPEAAVFIKRVEAQAMPPRLTHVAMDVSERVEIGQRVAAFRAHQRRLSREREAFYEATQSKIRDVLGNEIKPGPL